MGIEFAEAVFTPGQMVGFFRSGMPQDLRHSRCLGGERLTLVKGLGADLTTVIDPHQACSQLALVRIW